MILTNTKIQTAIIKAWYSIALKSIKYYGGLAIGVNNSCLLKQIRLLRAYVNILKCFKIVGSTPTCNCHIEGDYTVELVDGVEITSSPIQFGCNNEGYLVYNGTGYPFTYYYDSNNSLIQINFTTIEESITLEDVQFTDNCNIRFNNSISLLETSTFIVENPPTILEGLNGSITILDDLGTPIYFLLVPNNLLTNPEELVNYWNTERADTNFILFYENGEYIFIAPFGQNYNGWTSRFSQNEGGSDGSLLFINPVPQPFINNTTEATASITPNPDDFTGTGLITVRFNSNTIYSFSTNYTLERFVENFNLSNTEGLTVALVNSELVFTAPAGSGGQLNGETLTITSFISGTNSYNPVFSNGVDTTALFLYWELVSNSVTYIVYTDLGFVNYTSIQQFIDAFNNGNNLGCNAVLEGNNIRINAPTNSFGLFDGASVRLSYVYQSSQYTNYNETEFFQNAIWYELVSYFGEFQNEYQIGEFNNNNPCEPETVEQYCLSNKNIISIIKHIDRIVS